MDGLRVVQAVGAIWRDRDHRPTILVGEDLIMRLLQASVLAVGLVFGSAWEAQASTVSFSASEEDGAAIGGGTLTFDAADPTNGSISFSLSSGTPDMAPPLFSANTVGPLTISITDQNGALVIDARGKGVFSFTDGSTSGGELFAGGTFLPGSPDPSILEGFASVSAVSTTGVSGGAVAGTTLSGTPSLFPAPVPLPSAGLQFGLGMLALAAIGHRRAYRR